MAGYLNRATIYYGFSTGSVGRYTARIHWYLTVWLRILKIGLENLLPVLKNSTEGFLTVLASYKKVHMDVIRENIAEGEQVRKYVIEAKIRGKWSQITDGK